MSLDKDICGNKSLETSHTSSSICGGRGSRSSMTSHSASHIRGGYVDIGESRSQDTRHCYSYNRGTRVLVEGRGRYRSLTRHNPHPHP